jgi:hypothetical protein
MKFHFLNLRREKCKRIFKKKVTLNDQIAAIAALWRYSVAEFEQTAIVLRYVVVQGSYSSAMAL